MKTWHRIIRWACILALSATVSAAEETPQVLHFRISMTTNMTIESGSKTQKVHNESATEYTRERKGQTVQVLCDSISVKSSGDGVVSCEGVMNRQKQSFVYSDGKKDEHLAENEPKVRKSLEAKFGSVLATLELNEDGSEAKRKLTVDPDAKELIDGGTLTNCLLFHAPFPQKANWTRKIEFGAPGGGSLNGELKYEKVTSPGDNPEADKQVTIKVTGTLTADTIRNAAGNQKIKGVKMTIEGEQVYDRDLKEWISGTHHASIAFPMENVKSEEVFKLECLSKQNAGTIPQIRK
jgi:hypothetical protein